MKTNPRSGGGGKKGEIRDAKSGRGGQGAIGQESVVPSGGWPAGESEDRNHAALPTEEDLWATVKQCLRDARRHEEARLVGLCELQLVRVRLVSGDNYEVDMVLVGKVDVLRRLTSMSCLDDEPEGMRRVRNALKVSLPAGYRVGALELRLTPVKRAVNGEKKPASHNMKATAGGQWTEEGTRGSEVASEGGQREELPAPGLQREDAPSEEEELTVARRVFGILEKLRTEPGMRKAPLFEVFHLAVMEGLPGKEVAKRCQCAASLISARVSALEKRLGMGIERLRSLATKIREIESVVKGGTQGPVEG